MDIRDKIKYILKETNPWWMGGTYTVNGYSHRDIFSNIEKFLKMRQIIALVGLRRTGKTTLMLKVVERYAAEIPVKNILYFSFDDFSSIDIEDILSGYGEIFPDLDIGKDRFLFCLDEIQKLINWQDKVKRVYDLYPNIKIVVSGSESLFIRKGIKETLGGRIFEFKVSTLSFKEYLAFTGHEKFTHNMELHEKEIIKLYRKFMKISGFPELVNVDDEMIIHKYVKEAIVDKIIFKDIPQIFKVRNPELVGEILDIIVYAPGQIIDISKLAKEMSLSRQVVSSYLDYLEKAFLIRRLYNFSRNFRKQKRALKKYYPAITFPVIVDDKFSLCFESSLIWQLEAQFFYRDTYQNEVDAILIDKDKSVVPIEIKTGNIDFKGVNHFKKRFESKNAIILTLDQEKVVEGVMIKPFYKYLLSRPVSVA